MLPTEEQFLIELLKMNPTREILLKFKAMIKEQHLPTWETRKEFFQKERWKETINELLAKSDDQATTELLQELLVLLERQTNPELSEQMIEPIKELFFYDWKIAVLPESLRELKQLENLSIYADPDHDTDIPLKSIPESIGQLKNLKYLALQRMNLTQLPESIGQLEKLVELELQKCGITKLPESIGQLKELRLLDASYNNLRELPESIGNLKKLKELRLVDCPLERLPEAIGKLENLKILDLGETSSLTKLPKSITNLTSLETIYINEVELTPEQEEWLQTIKNAHFRE